MIERLVEFRWIAEPVDTDVGEDLWVRIFDDESFSGILFLTQLKSRGDITNHERAETIAQRVTTAHLKHWEGSASPVVVMVWDAPKGEGYWLTVDSALRTLSTDKPSFVDQETVTLQVPATNRIDRDGLRRLRSELAQLLLPAVQKERLIEMRLRFKFPKTEEALRQKDALDRVLKYGEPATIDGAFVEELRHEGWYARPSVDTSNPATSGHLKTGHQRWPSETGYRC